MDGSSRAPSRQSHLRPPTRPTRTGDEMTPPTTGRLCAGRVVAVTGAGRGLGRAHAL
ncbi:hypothetical protein GTX14_10420, partial [Streptomyces sp. SID4944]|nr:hypothetical protein [Streptomyces sp. SID4944]